MTAAPMFFWLVAEGDHDEDDFQALEEHALEGEGEGVPVADAAPGLPGRGLGGGDLPQVRARLVVQGLVAGRPEHGLAQPLEAEDQQQRADDEAQAGQRQVADRGADRGGDHGQDDERDGHALERGLPLPGDARGQDDGERLDGFDRARDEDREDQGEGIQ